MTQEKQTHAIRNEVPAALAVEIYYVLELQRFFHYDEVDHFHLR